MALLFLIVIKFNYNMPSQVDWILFVTAKEDVIAGSIVAIQKLKGHVVVTINLSICGCANNAN